MVFGPEPGLHKVLNWYLMRPRRRMHPTNVVSREVDFTKQAPSEWQMAVRRWRSTYFLPTTSSRNSSSSSNVKLRVHCSIFGDAQSRETNFQEIAFDTFPGVSEQSTVSTCASSS